MQPFVLHPSSDTTDIEPISDHPYFWVHDITGLNATTPVFSNFSIVPLGQYADIEYGHFTRLVSVGRLATVTPANIGSVESRDISLISCNPDDYEDGVLDGTDLVLSLANTRLHATVILYSRTTRSCGVDGELPDTMASIFTTVDPLVASALADNPNLAQSSNTQVVISADDNSYTNSSARYGEGSHGNYHMPSGTTQVAMIILYTITGVITTLFVVIILTGAVRAHRHPERYGPRNGNNGRGRQSRAKGIARAMLETLPIVKFGDQQEQPPKRAESPNVADIEMHASASPAEEVTSTNTKGDGQKGVAVTATPVVAPAQGSSDRVEPVEWPQPVVAAVGNTKSNADGRDEAGTLGCSICTEDFTKGEEVRVLPCNHKFHPDCVDPWLLNVSGTCPLCRIDLRPHPDDEAQGDDPEHSNHNASAAPPLETTPNTNTSIVQNLRAALSGSREERIAALRRFRSERNTRNSVATVIPEEERMNRSRRFRERFRIRTGHHGAADQQQTEDTNDPQWRQRRRASSAAYESYATHSLTNRSNSNAGSNAAGNGNEGSRGMAMYFSPW